MAASNMTNFMNIYNDGGIHNLTAPDGVDIALYQVANSTTLHINLDHLRETTATSSPSSSSSAIYSLFQAPDGMGETVPTFLIDNESHFTIEGLLGGSSSSSAISILGSNGTESTPDGGPAIQILGGSSAQFFQSTFLASETNVTTVLPSASDSVSSSSSSIQITGGSAHPTTEGSTGGDALHVSRANTTGTLLAGRYRGGASSAGTRGNSLRVSDGAAVTVRDGEFVGNILVEGGASLEVHRAVFVFEETESDDGGGGGTISTEILVFGEESRVVFLNGCFEATVSEEDEGVLYIVGYFLDDARESLGSHWDVIVSQIDGGVVQIVNDDDCSLYLSMVVDPKDPVVFSDGGTHNLTAADGGTKTYRVINDTTLRIHESMTYILAPDVTISDSDSDIDEHHAAITMDSDSRLFIAGSDIFISGSNGTEVFPQGGTAVKIIGGSVAFFETVSPNEIVISGGSAYGEGSVGGDALHFDGRNTKGTIVSGIYRGGNSTMGTPGNALRVSSSSQVSVVGGHFHGNVYIESGNVTIQQAVFAPSSEILVYSNGSVVFENSCFEFSPGEDEEVIYAKGYFVQDGSLSDYQEITSLSIGGGVVEKSDHPDCNSLMNAVVQPEDPDSSTDDVTAADDDLLQSPTDDLLATDDALVPPDDDDSEALDDDTDSGLPDVVVFDDGGIHELTASESGNSLYQVLNSSKLNIQESATYITAPSGVAEPAIYLNNSQLLLLGNDITITGAGGSANTTGRDGGAAIHATNGATVSLQIADIEGTTIAIRGGAPSSGGVGGPALILEGERTTGYITGGEFYGGVSDSFSNYTGLSLMVANMAEMTITGGFFYGDIEAFGSNIQLNGGVFDVDMTEVIANGTGSIITFGNGCFVLERAGDDETKVYVNGYFIGADGAAETYQNITARQLDGGIVGKTDHKDCSNAPGSPSTSTEPTLSPNVDPESNGVRVFDDGGTHALLESDSGVAQYQVLDSTTLTIQDRSTYIYAPSDANAPAIFVNNSQLLILGSNILISGATGSTNQDLNDGGTAIQVVGGGFVSIENGGNETEPVVIRGGMAALDGVGGTALHVDGAGTTASIISGDFYGGSSSASRDNIGLSLLVTNSAEVTVSGGTFYGNMMAQGTRLNVNGGVYDYGTEVVADGEGAAVTFGNGCFEFETSGENDTVIILKGYFVGANETLGPYQSITARELNGGMIGKIDRDDCTDNVVTTSVPPIAGIPEDDSETLQYIVEFNDGGTYDVQALGNGDALYRVTDSSQLNIQESGTRLEAPEGVSQPTILVDNSQLTVFGNEILVLGSKGGTEIATKDGGAAIHVMAGGSASIESADSEGESVVIQGGDASSDGVGGAAMIFEGEGTTGTIVSGVFSGGLSDFSSSNVGVALIARDLADVTVSGGVFEGNIVSEAANLKLNGGNFTGSSEVVADGSGGFVTFGNGCFTLERSKSDLTVVTLNGYFVLADGEPGPNQTITTKEVNGGSIGKIDRDDCRVPTVAPSSPFPTAFSTGGTEIPTADILAPGNSTATNTMESVAPSVAPSRGPDLSREAPPPRSVSGASLISNCLAPLLKGSLLFSIIFA
ncbi:hypothetical protein ACHAXS_014141 [Conticribra weissflogii]